MPPPIGAAPPTGPPPVPGSPGGSGGPCAIKDVLEIDNAIINVSFNSIFFHGLYVLADEYFLSKHLRSCDNPCNE